MSRRGLSRPVQYGLPVLEEVFFCRLLDVELGKVSGDQQNLNPAGSVPCEGEQCLEFQVKS